jgi:hypothetical protein
MLQTPLACIWERTGVEECSYLKSMEVPHWFREISSFLPVSVSSSMSTVLCLFLDGPGRISSGMYRGFLNGKTAAPSLHRK